MSLFIPDTNYFITNPQGELVDISTLFNPGTCPTATDYFFFNYTLVTPAYVDLNTVINAITSEAPLPDTGFKVTISGVQKDISEIFQPKITASTFYTISPTGYPTKEVQSGGYYYIGFGIEQSSTPATITFLQNISTINVVVVGGGGCGRDWSFFGEIRSGGGGAGGGVAKATFSTAPGDSFTVSVGLGGIPQPNGSATPAYPSSFTSVSNSANNITCTAGGTGINNGSGYAIGGVGTVSGGLFSNITAGTGGDGGESLISSGGSTSINDGGDSVIPSLVVPSGFTLRLGGGGGAGDYGSTTFGGTAGNGVGGICGAAPTAQGTSPTGFGCGGGGSASQGNTDDSKGSYGLVLIYFTFP
jgi:hypothetical protein